MWQMANPTFQIPNMAKAKEIVGLDCNADALEGMGLVLRVRFEEVCAFREAATDWSDIEGVHDMRVAARRLRSALRDFLPFIKKRPLKRVREELKIIADALGAVRDQDVAIVALKDLKEEAEQKEIKQGIENLIEEYSVVRNKAQARLIETITIENLAQLHEDFASAIEEAIKVTREEIENNQSNNINLSQAGCSVITSSLKEFLAAGERIYEPFNVKALHKLRIAAKRLRYAIELFAPCWGEEVLSVAHEIAEMQSSLGELHDCDAWIEDLGQRLKRDEKSDTNTQRNSQADVWLLSHFIKTRTKDYRAALERWNEWQQNQFAENLLKICSITSSD